MFKLKLVVVASMLLLVALVLVWLARDDLDRVAPIRSFVPVSDRLALHDAGTKGPQAPAARWELARYDRRGAAISLTSVLEDVQMVSIRASSIIAVSQRGIFEVDFADPDSIPKRIANGSSMHDEFAKELMSPRELELRNMRLPMAREEFRWNARSSTYFGVSVLLYVASLIGILINNSITADVMAWLCCLIIFAEVLVMEPQPPLTIVAAVGLGLMAIILEALTRRFMQNCGT